MMKKVEILTSLFFVAFLSLLIACGDDPSIEPPYSHIYFESTGESKQYTSKELIADVLDFAPGESIPVNFPDVDVTVEVIKYHTVDPQGKSVIASGIISYPSSRTPKGVVLAEHFTISAANEAPSRQMCIVETALSLYDYLVIAPDYIGFGSTESLRHPYLHIESTAQVSLDMLFAVHEYMEMKEQSLPGNLYIAGYSQGGAAALAVQKMAEEKYPSDVKIHSVIAGGGAYDLAAIFDGFAKEETVAYPCSLPLTIIGMDYGDGLNLDYSKVFIEPLLSNYDEWVNSKKYNTDEINQKLSHTVRTFIHPDLYKEGMNSEFKKIYTSLDKNSLINWAPKAPILLVHGKNDDVVPYFCAQNAYDSFQAKGSKVELISTNSGHKETAITYYLYLLTRLM
ncbi:pimeloyl-ACP methyl ester carboxylesterase [Parabacteroides sp. PF5-5]|uniref:alpha/beta hydrolase family protein n=1 Tax=unclassified Parabacteroides TaxID=2649774 RepID=UPI0024747A1B|nr:MULTISPECIES: lipase family protein [unclassified Parabacteroides]MDH6305696.1 pimeloyl-ACP methyl ester carboxylesterase [Parabacteroides sp. PH5-39]MDH6316768.1 pimeloyl-ACP methyl ester carboxylesterase [Parabacteroides sp. PF5-13]MDH6320409.1 pimeloyl-ACP methyl ester carboxylesterase [Parabacteroides sp. PH5-13]MDH6324139.1 pimeloyl-ACP methyl ester carboxylesterase [Parabacteroides sp. PH5-8]MDH6327954.1 pimeloyl-ACP methyl ester carboxylesterase [Parabacteroides sp. PH5-41]